jgi:hypothetical protein
VPALDATASRAPVSQVPGVHVFLPKRNRDVALQQPLAGSAVAFPPDRDIACHGQQGCEEVRRSSLRRAPAGIRTERWPTEVLGLSDVRRPLVRALVLVLGALVGAALAVLSERVDNEESSPGCAWDTKTRCAP